MFLKSKLFILVFALAAVMGGQLFGVRGGLVCKCGPYTVAVSGQECSVEECHDAAEHDEDHDANVGEEHEHEGPEPLHHQVETLDFEVASGLPGPVELPQVFLLQSLPFAFVSGGLMDTSVAAALRLAHPGRWGPGAETPLVSQPLIVAEFTVLLI